MNYVRTADLGRTFFTAHDRMAEAVEADSLVLLPVEMAESGVRAAARNPTTNASGLIQFMPSTLRGLGYAHGDAAFRQLTAEEQLRWVRAYFLPHRGMLTSVPRAYVAVFLPALLPKATSDDYVLCARGGQLGWAYAANAVFDANNDYTITVGELGEAVRRNMVGPRWEEIYYRATGKPLVTPDVGYDLRTTLGQQRALARLGYAPGDLDGFPGPRTAAAVRAFQVAAGLKVDGIIGPMTRDALARKLAA